MLENLENKKRVLMKDSMEMWEGLPLVWLTALLFWTLARVVIDNNIKWQKVLKDMKLKLFNEIDPQQFSDIEQKMNDWELINIRWSLKNFTDTCWARCFELLTKNNQVYLEWFDRNLYAIYWSAWIGVLIAFYLFAKNWFERPF